MAGLRNRPFKYRGLNIRVESLVRVVYLCFKFSYYVSDIPWLGLFAVVSWCLMMSHLANNSSATSLATVFDPNPYVERAAFSMHEVKVHPPMSPCPSSFVHLCHCSVKKSQIRQWLKSHTGTTSYGRLHQAAKHLRTSPADAPNSSGFDRGSRSLESVVELLVWSQVGLSCARSRIGF